MIFFNEKGKKQCYVFLFHILICIYFKCFRNALSKWYKWYRISKCSHNIIFVYLSTNLESNLIYGSVLNSKIWCFVFISTDMYVQWCQCAGPDSSTSYLCGWVRFTTCNITPVPCRDNYLCSKVVWEAAYSIQVQSKFDPQLNFFKILYRSLVGEIRGEGLITLSYPNVSLFKFVHHFPLLLIGEVSYFSHN